MKYLLQLIIIFLSVIGQAQVGIGNSNPKSTLDITATSEGNPSYNDGILIPRINKFPDINPTVEQTGLLVYLTQTDGNDAKGFYYWDNAVPDWIPFGGEWLDGENTNGDQLIYAKQADANGTRIVFTDDGKIGIGTDDPIERFEFRGPGDNDFQITSANPNPPNLIFYNTGGTLESPDVLAANGEIGSVIFKTHDGVDVEEVGGVRLYMDGVATENDTPSKFVVETVEAGTTLQVERLVIRNDGDVEISDLSSANNGTVTYPAEVYAESDGTLFVGNNLNGQNNISGVLAVNQDINVITVLESETDDELEQDTESSSAALHTYSVTPTDDMLLEVNYSLAAKLTQDDSQGDFLIKAPDSHHDTGLYGAYVALSDGMTTSRYAINADNFTGTPDAAFQGPYYLSGKGYIPLTAGTAYTIELKGFIHTPRGNTKGWRVEFGGNSGYSRFQIVNFQ